MALLDAVVSWFGPGFAAFVWLLWELYCPLPNHTTKLQSFHNDLTTRFQRLEVGQISLAEQIEDADEDRFREIHDKDRLTTEAFKDRHGD